MPWKKFCVLQKKVLSFGPNRTVEVRPNSSAEPNVRSITMWRTACVIYVTINWWNSNAHCCWICSFRKISKIIGPSIPQNHLKTDISMWDTLYLIEKNFWNIRLKPRICKNFEITKTVYVFKQNKMLFQHVPGDFFDLIHKYMRTIIIPIE